jgi:hypothetical protein
MEYGMTFICYDIYVVTKVILTITVSFFLNKKISRVPCCSLRHLVCVAILSASVVLMVL